MHNNYTLICTDWNQNHVKFNLFDRFGANCGSLVILATDIIYFLQSAWKGNINWNGKMPDYILNYPTPLKSNA